MLTSFRQSSELIRMLIWKNMALRYKQAYLGVLWVILKPLMLMVVFSLIRSIIGFNAGPIPYAVLVFAALTMWTFFQESATEGAFSVVGNAQLIRKIYFPREIFPVVSVLTKLASFFINFALLLALMAWFGLAPGIHVWWCLPLLLYAFLFSLAVALSAGALNVYFRDVGQAMPVLLTVMMYASPILYPMQLVREKLLVQGAGGEHAALYFNLYALNPMAGLIDGFQRALLFDKAPDPAVVLPGLGLVALFLPLSYLLFKRAESHFTDVI
jgi:lipopolysaccharide transport system permease protein